MLHYNAPRVEDDSYHRGAATINAPLEASAWKVLILDAVGQRILSPIMKVNDLRDHGVTLYLYPSATHPPPSPPHQPAILFVDSCTVTASRFRMCRLSTLWSHRRKTLRGLARICKRTCMNHSI